MTVSFSLEDLGITQEEFEREMQIYCDCDEPEAPYYVDYARIPNVGVVDHHGWICKRCGKYAQVG